MKALYVEKPGGVENFVEKQIDIPALKNDEVRVKHTVLGLNFIDIYHRTGQYPLPYPAIIGVEAAGVVEEVGASVREFKTGDKVAYCTAPPGTYQEKRNVAAEVLVKIPAGISDEVAAASMVKGLTAWYLLKKTYPVKKGDKILVHAAAGGVGLIISQWATAIGAEVYGTTSSPEKEKLALQNGCYKISNYKNFQNDFKDVQFDVVYDSVGKDTFLNSLEMLKPLGLMASYGQASGKVEPIDISILQKKSLFLTRPSLFTYANERQDLEEGAAEIFGEIIKGNLKINITNRYKFSEIAKAHSELESRKTTGSSVIIF